MTTKTITEYDETGQVVAQFMVTSEAPPVEWWWKIPLRLVIFVIGIRMMHYV